jgi:hypothetical protein
MPSSTYSLARDSLGSPAASCSQNLSLTTLPPADSTPIPRSASHTYLPSVNGTTEEEPLAPPLKRALSENIIAALPRSYERQSFSDRLSRVTPVHQGMPLGDRVVQQKISSSPASKITMSKFRNSSEKTMGDTSYESKTSKLAKRSPTESKTRGVPESFATFARKSWKLRPSSRSPPPNRKTYLEEVEQTSSSSELPSGESNASRTSKASTVQQNGDSEPKDSGYDMGSKVISKKGSPLQNRLSRKSSRQSLFKVASLERMPSARNSFSSERQQNLPVENSRKKDELWSVFRGLESDFHK